MRKHHELKAWQEAMELVKEIYRVTRSFPKEEIYGLVSNLKQINLVKKQDNLLSKLLILRSRVK